MTQLKRIVPCFVVMTVASCGGGQPADSAADIDTEGSAVEESGDSSAESEEPELAWADMDREQRMEFMGLTVLPEMKKLFQEADPDGYEDFKCQTCHGEDMKAVDYKMPNGLFALEKPDPIPASKDYDAETTAFMMDSVVPKMAGLMGMEPGKELNCFSCHDAEE